MRRRPRFGLASVLAISACAVVAIVAAPAQGAVTYDGSFGSGIGTGSFEPRGIAVNHTTGDVYVALVNRVSQFSSTGAFIRTWGAGVNQTTGANVCTAASGDICGGGFSGELAGALNGAVGIAVDNSGGPAAGSVYVEEVNNNRIQRFTAEGQFVLMWGKGVNLNTGANLCAAASGDVCKKGEISGAPAGKDEDGSDLPEVPSAPGEFSGWTKVATTPMPGLAVDGAGFVYVGDRFARPYPRVQKFDPSGSVVAQIAAPNDVSGHRAIQVEKGITVNAAGDVYVVDEGHNFNEGVKQFDAADFTPSGLTAAYERVFDFKGFPLLAAVDPSNQYLFVIDDTKAPCAKLGGASHIEEYHPDSGEEVDCTLPADPAPSLTNARGMAVSPAHKLYVAVGSQVHIFNTPVASPPEVGAQKAKAITTTSAIVEAPVAGNLSTTTVHVEYGPAPCSTNPCASTDESGSIGASIPPKTAAVPLDGLTPATTYHYRLVATNGEGFDEGPDLTFTTFAEPTFDPSCANNLARQQTGASYLLDCRAYELVSAEDTGGYNVASDLLAGQAPYGGYPQARDRALYAVHNGGIPGTGKPTNRGPDPYLAVRDAENRRWSTEYVGIPADAPSAGPFSSTLSGADAGLRTFAFGGPELCSPCFPDGKSGLPVRMPDGSLIQGMGGSGTVPIADPQPAGEVRKRLSDDGSHLIFGSMQRFAPNANDNGADLTIYDRDLEAGTTQAVSTLPDGSTIAAGDDVVALDVSADGSRILIGDRVSTDAAGNDYYDLYMHVGSSPNSIEIADTPSGALYSGMTADGTEVFFTTRDAMATATDQDTDTSADLYRADLDGLAATLTRISTGLDGSGDTDLCDPVRNSRNERWNSVVSAAGCDTVAIGGGGGVAREDGTVYFLSPEQLDGASNGEQDSPNLYVARPGEEPRYVATLESFLTGPQPPQTTHGYRQNFGSAGGAFKSAIGVAVDHLSGYVYVLDNSTQRAVERFDRDGNPVNFTAGPNAGTNRLTGAGTPRGSLGSSFGQHPSGHIAVDPTTGDLYVPTVGNGIQAVYVFASTGAYKSQIVTTEVPVAVAINPVNHNVYVIRHHTGNSTQSLLIYTPAGVLVSTVLSGVTTLRGGLAVDSSQNLYVAGTNGVRVYDSSNALVNAIDSTESLGVSVDPADDHVYVNKGDRILEFDPSGAPVGLPSGVGELSGSRGIAADSGNVYATDGFFATDVNNSIAKFEFEYFSSPQVDNPLVTNGVNAAGERRTGDFQLTPDGAQATFTSTLPLSGFDSARHGEVFHYDAGSDQLTCASCNPTGAPPSGDTSLASDGLSIADDGRVFFTSGEPLVLRDTNGRKDAYEWKDGMIELISTGTSAFDSGFLTASADGTDAFFFTREKLTPNDRNGTLMKIYTAREDGGFFIVPPPPPCAASDECHGPGSQAAGPPAINTVSKTDGNAGNSAGPKAPKRCRRGFVKKRGKCVKRPKNRNKAAGRKRNRGHRSAR